MQSVALREAIKEYEANKWKVIGQKVGKPAKVSPKIFPPFVGPSTSADLILQACEQYAKEHFRNV